MTDLTVTRDVLADDFGIRSEVELFATEAEWLKARGRRLTSSRGPIVAGVRGSAYALNLELRGRLEVREPEGLHLEVGRLLEPVLLQMLAAMVPGLQLFDPGYAIFSDPERPWLAASLDAVARHPDLEGPGAVELKTTDSIRRSDWITEEGTFQIPAYPLAQLNHHALAAAGLKWGVVACLVGIGFSCRFVYKVLHVDQTWQREVYLPQLEAFQGALERDEDWPADGSVATGEAVARLWPKEVAGKSVVLPESASALVDALETARAEKSAWKKIEDENKARLAALMGDAEVGLVDGERYVQWRVEPRKGHVVKASSPRVLRIRPR